MYIRMYVLLGSEHATTRARRKGFSETQTCFGSDQNGKGVVKMLYT